MSRFLRHSIGQIFGNPSTGILVMVFLLIAGLSLTMAIFSYNTHVEAAIDKEFATLRATARSLSLSIDGLAHQKLAESHKHLDDITSTESDSNYASIARTLKKTHDVMGMQSDVYTVMLDEDKGRFEFMVTSAENPYYRHIWSHPHEEHETLYDVGACIGPYEDENGVWLSSFAPIKVGGKTIAIVQADKLFSDFVQEARNEFKEVLLIFGLIFLLATVVLLKLIDRILSKEATIQEKIVAQARLIEIKNKDIMSSIRVAKRLQEAVLPRLCSIRKDIPEFSVMYQPKDIVSGDFFWYEKVGSKVYLAAGDCTGHGIPGAFMSMIGHTSLYHVLNKNKDCLGGLLTELDQTIRTHIHKGSKNNEGMDMAICSFDMDSGELKYAGALRPLILIRDGRMIKIKGNRSGIGGHSDNMSFKEHIVDVIPGDVVYMFSDGFGDQFGGAEGRKYMSKRFSDFLCTIQEHSIEEQNLLLQYEFNLWKENEEQVDDVLVMGFRIPEFPGMYRISA